MSQLKYSSIDIGHVVCITISATLCLINLIRHEFALAFAMGIIALCQVAIWRLKRHA